MIPNLPDEAKKRLLCKTSIYFHPTPGEHFGISVVEATLLGAIPVVHGFSGACIGVVRKYEFGYCYNTLGGAISIISKILEENHSRGEGVYENKNVKRLREAFSYNTFREKVVEILSLLVDAA